MTTDLLKKVVFTNQLALTWDGLDLVVVILDENCINNKTLITEEAQRLDATIAGIPARLVATGGFEGKWLETATSLANLGKGDLRICLLGAGKKSTTPESRARHLGIALASELEKLKVNRLAVLAHTPLLSESRHWEQFVVGFKMGVYRYPKANLSDKDRANLETPVELCCISPQNAAPNLAAAEITAKAIDLCRYFQDGPPNYATPEAIASEALRRANQLGLKTQVMGRTELEKLGFNAMLAVAGGSVKEPQFVVIEYAPTNATKTLALVGKGLTMDTGGYSLKPSTGQQGMKYDMSGAAVTLSSVLAIAELGLSVRVLGVAALCENMVDANAYRVDDVVTSYSQKTIEIKNTDAEGRVVLADALAYTAKDLKPDAIVEFSTLTGAMVVALGHFGAGVFPFAPPHFVEQLQRASCASGEPVWVMPIWDEIIDELKGTVSDLTNLGSTTLGGGSIFAAAFLKEFVEDIPFAHIDIAGVASDNMALGYPRKGGAGFGVQLSIEIARLFADA